MKKGSDSKYREPLMILEEEEDQTESDESSSE